MEDQNLHNIPAEEEGLDLIALAKSLWKERKIIFICTGIFIALGLAAALTMKHTYTVSSILVPQISGGSRYVSMGSLAAMAGYDLGTASLSSSDLSPLVYPQILKSATFQLDLLNTKYHFEKADSTITLYTYLKDYNNPSKFAKFLGVLRKYTLGLPSTIMGAINNIKPEKESKYEAQSIAVEGEDSYTVKPIVLSKEEASFTKAVASRMSLTVDRKEGYLTLTVSGAEPLQTAEMAIRVIELLQNEVTAYRTTKAQHQLEYIQARYDEVKAEMELYQTQLATIRDRNQQMLTTRARIEQDRVQTKFAVASSIYAELSKQLETAKMQVKRDTPTITVVQPITVPRSPSTSRSRTLLVWTFVGILLGCGIVLGKEYFPKIKESFNRQ